MKKFSLLLVLVIAGILLTGCGNASSDGEHLITPEVPDGATFIDSCTHMIAYTPDLPPTDSTGLLFLPDNRDLVSMLVTYRRPDEIEKGVKLNQLAIYVTGLFEAQAGSLYMESTQVVDYQNQTLEAVYFELISVDDIKTKALIVIRPETELMDGEVGNAIFQVMAQGPVDQWDNYGDSFEVFFETFHPKSCP